MGAGPIGQELMFGFVHVRIGLGAGVVDGPGAPYFEMPVLAGHRRS